MKSWRKWGMRALALAMLLSLSAGPLAAVPRGGHSSGDETIDLLDGPGVEFFGDPDDGGIGKANRFDAADLRIRSWMELLSRAFVALNPTCEWIVQAQIGSGIRTPVVSNSRVNQ